MLQIDNSYVCEYSPSQRAFHVERLEDAVWGNLRALLDGRPADFIPFAVADSCDEAHRICNTFRDRFRGQDAIKRDARYIWMADGYLKHRWEAADRDRDSGFLSGNPEGTSDLGLMET